MKLDIKYLSEVAKLSNKGSKSNEMFRSDQMAVDIVTLKSGQYVSPETIYMADTLYFVFEGEGVFEVDGDVSILIRNASMFVERGQSVGIINEGEENLILLKVQAPPEGY